MRSEGPIDRARVLNWMTQPDLETRALVYSLTDNAWSRITPELTMEQQCSFMQKYLLDAVGANRRDEECIHSGFEAAWELAAWLKHLYCLPKTEKIIARVVADLEQLYRTSDAETRNRIETGAVEHIFEEKGLRKYFEHWRRDPDLRTAYELCLAWGKAHSNTS